MATDIEAEQRRNPNNHVDHSLYFRPTNKQKTVQRHTQPTSCSIIRKDPAFHSSSFLDPEPVLRSRMNSSSGLILCSEPTQVGTAKPFITVKLAHLRSDNQVINHSGSKSSGKVRPISCLSLQSRTSRDHPASLTSIPYFVWRHSL